MDSISTMVNGSLISDYVTQRYYEASSLEKISYNLRVNISDNTFFRNKSSDLTIIRNGELQSRPLKFWYATGGTFMIAANKSDWDDNYFYRDNPVYNSLKDYNKVFDSDAVYAYKEEF
jgi:hypothetical protein